MAWWIVSSLRSGEVLPLNGWLRLSYSFVIGSYLGTFVESKAVVLLLRAHAGMYVHAIVIAVALPLGWYVAEQGLRALEGRRISLPFHRVVPNVKRAKGFGLWIGEATGLLATVALLPATRGEGARSADEGSRR